MSFSHRDAGTPESRWADAFAARTLPECAIAFDRLVVVSAHPDDETLGVGGLVQLAARRGARVAAVVLTDGENSHPDSTTVTPPELRRIRRDEVRAALALLAPDADVRFLALPDGALADHRDEAAAVLADILSEDARPTLVVSPWSGDRHPDHRAAAELARHVAESGGAAHRSYPIWLWHWAEPDDAPWPRMERVPLDAEARAAKRAALACHPSQTAPLSSRPGDEAVLHAAMQEHFARPFEILLSETARSTPEAHFDRFYAEHDDDPWGFDSRWYEARKRAVVLAALPRARYVSALELGCATGAFTAELAGRVDRVLAVDFAEAALDAARARLAGQPRVSLARATIPRDWPTGSFDLIVLAEMGYYLDADDLRDTIARMTASLEPGGHLVACHWRHPLSDGPLDGDAVHAALRGTPGLTSLVRHVEDDFVLDVLGVGTTSGSGRGSGLAP